MIKIDNNLIKKLACPICKEDLIFDKDDEKFFCVKNSKHIYGFTDGFPNFIVE